jgi:hypothetical protein
MIVLIVAQAKFLEYYNTQATEEKCGRIHLKIQDLWCRAGG